MGSAVDKTKQLGKWIDPTRNTTQGDIAAFAINPLLFGAKKLGAFDGQKTPKPATVDALPQQPDVGELIAKRIATLQRSKLTDTGLPSTFLTGPAGSGPGSKSLPGG